MTRSEAGVRGAVGAPGAPERAARFGLGFQSDKAIADYERLAAAAESYGFDVVSVFGDLWYQPPIVALLAMARATSRVRLGPACLNPFTLHPVEIAGQMRALAAASSGRAYLGLARGSWLEALGIDQRRGVSAVQEAVAVVSALLRGDTSGTQGERFALPAGESLRGGPLPWRVPLLVGTWGPRLARVAGAIADEVKLGGSANPAMVPLLRRWVDDGAAAAGRQPGAVGLVIGAVTVVDEDGAAARRRAREECAMYLEVVGALDRTLEVPPEVLSGIRRHLAAGERSAAGAMVPGELLARFAFAGTPGEVAEQAAGLLEAGVDRIEFGTPHGLSDDEGVRLLGGKVLPALRRC